MDFSREPLGNSLDNLTEHLRKAMNPNNVSYVHEEAYDPNYAHHQSYTNISRSNDISLSQSMNMEFSPSGEKPENNDVATNILAMLEQDNEPVE
jgi:hypothetical protein